jgi:hypothetical protein
MMPFSQPGPIYANGELMINDQLKLEDFQNSITVVLAMEYIQTACPQLDERAFEHLIEKHGDAIVAHMVSAGIAAVVQIVKGSGNVA